MTVSKSVKAKANWFVALSKLSPKKRVEVICCGKNGFFKDLQRVVRHVGRGKKVKLDTRHVKLFKKHRGLLKKISTCRSPSKVKNLLLKKTKGGFLPLIPILGSLIPSLVNLAATELPKLFA